MPVEVGCAPSSIEQTRVRSMRAAIRSGAAPCEMIADSRQWAALRNSPSPRFLLRGRESLSVLSRRADSLAGEWGERGTSPVPPSPQPSPSRERVSSTLSRERALVNAVSPGRDPAPCGRGGVRGRLASVSPSPQPSPIKGEVVSCSTLEQVGGEEEAPAPAGPRAGSSPQNLSRGRGRRAARSRPGPRCAARSSTMRR